MDQPTTNNHGEGVVAFKRAEPENVPLINRIVDAAYTKYIARIGKAPAPMAADWQELVASHDVFVLWVDGRLVGTIVLVEDVGSLQIDSVVVDPSLQGRGHGRRLMVFAEETARRRGLEIVTLYTNEMMYENIELYSRLGYRETDRKMQDGFNRVFFRKDLISNS